MGPRRRPRGGQQLEQVSYTYDVFDNRIASTVNGVVAQFVYNGGTLWATVSFGSLQTVYVTGSQPDQYLGEVDFVPSLINPHSVVILYLTDHLGSVVTC